MDSLTCKCCIYPRILSYTDNLSRFCALLCIFLSKCGKNKCCNRGWTQVIFKFTLIAEHCYRVLAKTIKNVSYHHWVTETLPYKVDAQK